MPDEPRKPIEELLQASAKARRAEFGSDPKMPNPMRARLHDEIARAAREDEPKSRRNWNWFAISWPVGTVAAAVLVVAFVMSRSHELQPPNESRQMATNQPERAKGGSQPTTPQVAAKGTAESTTEPTDILKPDDEKSNDSRRFADVAAEPKKETPAAAAAPQPGSIASSSTFFAQTRKAGTNINQQFSRDLPPAAARLSKRKQAIDVLNTFQIQQNGDQIRVVDADGSTYTGKIEHAAQDGVGQTLKDKEGESLAARSERAQPQPDNTNQFYFRAAGYNTRLQKPIVFEGSYIATPSQSQSPNESGAKNQQQLPARIVGTAKVTGESQIEVDATSVPQ
jgi:hypothetical protein